MKSQKRQAVQAFFDEYAASKELPWLRFEQSEIKVNLSDSIKKLKEQSKTFIDKVQTELLLIQTQPQEQQAEILVEYKRTLNAAQAITSVAERRKATEDEKILLNQRDTRMQEQEKSIQTVNEVCASIGKPTETPLEQQYSATFTIHGTLEQLKALKQFLIQGGYNYEQ